MLKKLVYYRNRERMLRKGRIRSYERTEGHTDGPIDFVVTWVDGSDPVWREAKRSLEEKEGFSGKKDNGEERYRDWGLFRYWFRAVEKYAPWVNRIYLVTCSHVPKWLSEDCKKVKVVKHSEFMPAEYLPTFSSIPIEMNLHRIPGLSERFVYFNDDMFLAKPVLPEDFFKAGMPRHCAVLYPLRNDQENGSFQHQLFTALGLFNDLFASGISRTMKEQPEKWFSHEYGKAVKYNIRAYEDGYIPGLFFSHLATPFQKSTFEKVWEILGQRLYETCCHRFRTCYDIPHQIFSGWDIFHNHFYPVSKEYYGRVFASIPEQTAEIEEAFMGQRYRMVCLNDSPYIDGKSFKETGEKLIAIMEKAFGEKSEAEL